MDGMSDGVASTKRIVRLRISWIDRLATKQATCVAHSSDKKEAPTISKLVWLSNKVRDPFLKVGLQLNEPNPTP